MIILNLILTIMVIKMVFKNTITIYPEYVVYLSALYSFYLIISAIVNIIKYKKYNSPVLSSIKIVNLFTASVSILMLQTTLIVTFGDNPEDFMMLMNSITGGIICFIILIISTHMIIKGNIRIKK